MENTTNVLHPGSAFREEVKGLIHDFDFGNCLSCGMLPLAVPFPTWFQALTRAALCANCFWACGKKCSAIPLYFYATCVSAVPLNVPWVLKWVRWSGLSGGILHPGTIPRLFTESGPGAAGDRQPDVGNSRRVFGDLGLAAGRTSAGTGRPRLQDTPGQAGCGLFLCL